jgi:hypothetical protein
LAGCFAAYWHPSGVCRFVLLLSCWLPSTLSVARALGWSSFVAFRLPPPLLPLPPSSPVSAPSRSHPRFPLSLLACLQLPPAFVLLRGVDLTTFPVPAAFLHPVLRLSLSVSAHQISALPCLVCLPVCCAALRCAVRRHEPAAPSHAHSPMRRPWRRQSF